MTMQKIITADAWSFDTEQSIAIPMLRGDIGPNDRKAFSKRADEGLLSKIAQAKFSDDELPIHMIAVGSTEFFGANRNGDGFREETCRNSHPTFVKHARFYRNHKSSDKAKSYGVVKLSHYNEKMHRIELVVSLNKTAEAARRNGGLIADSELKKLAEGKDIPVSMGCGLAFDRCSHCSNEAKTRADYCDESMCKAGGLKHNMGKLCADGTVLHADNPNPTFNDISHVPRQADRTAYVLGALQKAASDSKRIISGAELAELIYVDESQPLSKLARDLADADAMSPSIELCFALSSRPLPKPLPIDGMRKLSQVVAALADNGIVLPADAFVHVLSGGKHSHVASLVKVACAGSFGRLSVPALNPYSHSGPVASNCLAWAASLAADYSLTPTHIAKRAGLSRLKNVTPTLLSVTKLASTDDAVDELVHQYGLYVVASLDRMRARNQNFPLTTVAAVLQNRVH